MAAYYQGDINPKIIRSKLEKKWIDQVPPMPTIYATIQRLADNDFLKLKVDVIKNKIYKTFVITDKGWELLSEMTSGMSRFLNVFEYHEKEMEFPRRRRQNE